MHRLTYSSLGRRNERYKVGAANSHGPTDGQTSGVMAISPAVVRGLVRRELSAAPADVFEVAVNLRTALPQSPPGETY